MKCQRCGEKKLKHQYMEWKIVTKSNTTSIALCLRCWVNLVVICIQTNRLSRQNLIDYANKHSEKLYPE